MTAHCSHTNVRTSPRKLAGVGTHNDSLRKEVTRPRLNIVVAGHSQLPDHIEDFDGHNVVTLKRGGATLWSLDRDLNTLWSLPADVVILFLGGNEIIDRSPADIKKKFREVIKNIQNRLNAFVFITLIESRDYRKSKHPVRRASADKYNKVRKFLNKYLTQSARAGKYRTVDLFGPPWAERKSDGVHLTKDGQAHLVRKWQQCVKRYSDGLYDRLVSVNNRDTSWVEHE